MAVNNHFEQSRQGRRLYEGGQVQMERQKNTKLYFIVEVPDGPYYLCYDLETMDFSGACTCLNDSFYNQLQHECRHCYGVRAWLRAHLNELMEATKNGRCMDENVPCVQRADAREE